MSDNKNQNKKSLLQSKGLYLSLIAVVAIIAGMVTYSMYKPVPQDNSGEFMPDVVYEPSATPLPNIKDALGINETQTSQPTPAVNGQNDEEKQAEENKSVDEKNTADDEATEVATQKDNKISPILPPDKLTRPVKGAVLKEFSKGAQVYSKTLDDWRVHDGLDIKGSIKGQVHAAAPGVVEDAYYDPTLGFCILLDHGGNIKTLYANLSTIEMVEKGKKVTPEDIISGIGDSAICETGEEAHLHFEVYENGVAVDPEKWFK